MSIITSLLDTDLYKITMFYSVLKTCGRLGIDIPVVQYCFKCRNKKNLLPFKEQIVKEINSFKKLKFTKNDIKYLMSLGYFDDEMAYYLSNINLNDVQVCVYDMDNELHIRIEGKWVPAILFEVPVLSIVNELYFNKKKVHGITAHGNLDSFIKEMKGLTFSDFGTRRRFSKRWQEHCIRQAKKANILTGTSNVYFAKKLNIKPVGTMAHEWLQAFQALSGELKDFQKDALNHWMLTYRGKLNTALTDILGIDAFLNDWDNFFAKNYSCLRHDSGDPIKFIEKVSHWYQGHYQAVDCKLPRLLFSDGLTPKTCLNIKAQYPTLDMAFGIGTNFTNNVGIEPLQIVIKLGKVNGQSVSKLSDSEGKNLEGDKNFINLLKTIKKEKGKV